MKIITNFLLLCCIKYSYSQNINYPKQIFKAKKTTIVCGKERTEPPFDITVTLDSNQVNLEIYGYGQASKYKFILDSLIKETNVFSTNSKLYYVSFIDLENDGKSYFTECSISNNEKRYFIQLKLPNSEQCVSTFELVPKKKSK